MSTFDDIQKANAAIRTTNIKGKEYAEVNQRIKAFRMVYPMGFIRTQLLSVEDGVCIMRAEVGDYVYYDHGDGDAVQEVILGTGTAYEKESSSYINKTSYIENCETSCIGRALGMAGFGIDTSVASFEEVTNAMANQNISEKEWKNLQGVCKGAGVDPMELIGKYGYNKASDITGADYLKMLKEVAHE